MIYVLLTMTMLLSQHPKAEEGPKGPHVSTSWRDGDQNLYRPSGLSIVHLLQFSISALSNTFPMQMGNNICQ